MATIEQDVTKNRILDAAGPIFAERGYQEATVREICQRAGVNLAAVNYHFGDKERLYREAVLRVHRQRNEGFPLPDWEEGTPAERRLEDFVATLLTRMLGGDRGYDWQSQLLLRELARPSQASLDIVKDYIRPHFKVLGGILRELLPADYSEERLRLLAFSVVGQCLYYRVADSIIHQLIPKSDYERLQPEFLAKHIARLVLAAVGKALPLGAEGATS